MKKLALSAAFIAAALLGTSGQVEAGLFSAGSYGSSGSTGGSTGSAASSGGSYGGLLDGGSSGGSSGGLTRREERLLLKASKASSGGSYGSTGSIGGSYGSTGTSAGSHGSTGASSGGSSGGPTARDLRLQDRAARRAASHGSSGGASHGSTGASSGAPVYAPAPVYVPAPVAPSHGGSYGRRAPAPSHGGSYGYRASAAPVAPRYHVAARPVAPAPVRQQQFAYCVVTLPQDATLYLGGNVTASAGAVRKFKIPVTDTQAHPYAVRVVLQRGGQSYVAQSVESLQAGKTVTVNVNDVATPAVQVAAR